MRREAIELLSPSDKEEGEPLWILQPAEAAPPEKDRRRATDAILQEVLRERPSRVSAARLLEESRR